MPTLSFQPIFVQNSEAFLLRPTKPLCYRALALNPYHLWFSEPLLFDDQQIQLGNKQQKEWR